MPCGICRQLLHEFAQLGSGDIQILASNTKKDAIIRTSVKELLPQAFGPKDLGIDLGCHR
jgi:cytidine deaminase